MIGIICAAGVGKRMLTETQEVPKPLLLYRSLPIVAHLINSLLNFCSQIIVVTSEDDLVESWIKDYYKDNKDILFAKQTEPLGNYYAVQSALKTLDQIIDIEKEQFLVSWSDFILDNNFAPIKSEHPVVYTSNISCRFSIKDNEIVESFGEEGVIGLYQFPARTLLKCNQKIISDKEVDLITLFTQKKLNYITKKIKVISLGTIEDLIEQKFELSPNRYFNRIEIKDNTFTKFSKTEEAHKLLISEFEWYRSIPKSIKNHIPQNINYDSKSNSLSMNLINGLALRDIEVNRELMERQIIPFLRKLHNQKAPDSLINQLQEASKQTYIERPINRLKAVSRHVAAYYRNVEIINDIEYKKEEEILSPPVDLISKEKYSFIHGDLQFSNLMLENSNIIAIDPRGYFGNVQLYGDPCYDIAKILYALDGYDMFNLGIFNIFKSKNKIFLIEPYKKNKECISLIKDYALSEYNCTKEKIDYLLWSIWMGLTSYTINNPKAVIGSYAKAYIRSKKSIFE